MNVNVNSTCNQMWNFLQPSYIPEKDEIDWLTKPEKFYEHTNFPNLIEALDGKQSNPLTILGLKFFNYKKFL